MARRKMIKIDSEKCNGCGECIPNCPEGALKIIDGKARLISDLFCDGLGACIGHCPQAAITIDEREAQEYDERRVMENIISQGGNVIRAHLEHLKEHGQKEYVNQAIDFLKEKGVQVTLRETSHTVAQHEHHFHGCPGSKAMDFGREKEPTEKREHISKVSSQLRQWPVQIALVPPHASYLKNADLLVAADCVPFAYADFHQELLRGKVLLVGCPKLDDSEFYEERLIEILKNNSIKSITCVHMEVPCCFGLVNIVKSAISDSGKEIPFKEVTISIKGEELK